MNYVTNDNEAFNGLLTTELLYSSYHEPHGCAILTNNTKLLQIIDMVLTEIVLGRPINDKMKSIFNVVDVSLTNYLVYDEEKPLITVTLEDGCFELKPTKNVTDILNFFNNLIKLYEGSLKFSKNFYDNNRVISDYILIYVFGLKTVIKNTHAEHYKFIGDSKYFTEPNLIWEASIDTLGNILLKKSV